MDTSLNQMKNQARDCFLAALKLGPEELWSLLWDIRYCMCDEDYPTDVHERTNTDQVRRVALEIIAEIVDRGPVRAFLYPLDEDRSLEESALTKGEAAARINVEWHEMGREPGMGELGGFFLPQLSVEPPATRPRNSE